MPTAPSSPDADAADAADAAPPGPVAALGLLVRFRLATLGVRGRRALAVGGAVALVLLVGAGVAGHLAARHVDELAARTAGSGVALSVPSLASALPTAFLAFLLTVSVAAIAAGGGREIVPAEQAVALPVGSTTDHLAALLWAPLSLAWVVPAAGLLATVGVVAGPGVAGFVAAEAVVVLWLVTATSIGQLLGWVAEAGRGLRAGPWAVRVVLAAVGLGLAALAVSGRVPTVAAVSGGGALAALVRAASGQGEHPAMTGLLGVVVLAAVAAAATVLGAGAARLAARRPPRVQAAAETRHHEHRPARSVRGTLLRLDRAGVWRSAPLRRGLLLLALLPLLIAVVGRIGWESLPVLPGLVASGGALLFGVNAWCLDAAGAWWRESLPASPATVFLVRTQVVAECLVLPAVATLAVCALRAGVPPSPSPVVAALGSALVVSARIVASALRWSVLHPHATDLRRPRATPAPPGTMLGYSARLALVGALGGLLFATLGVALSWPWIVLVTGLLLLPSLWSLRRSLHRWKDPHRRAGIVRTVASV